MLPPESTPNLSVDPERDPRLRDVLRHLDARHAVDADAVQRLDTRLTAALADPARYLAPARPTPMDAADPSRGTSPMAPLTLVRGMVLCAQQARRWVPVSVVAAAAAVLVAASMTPSPTMPSSSALVAYAGGKAGADLIVDDVLGLQDATASAFAGARIR